MPSSYPEQIPIIIDILLRLKPASILDIGVGFGKYGFLAREYLEIWGNSDSNFGNFKVQIDAVEGFDQYITPCHRYIYNNIYVEDAVRFVKTKEMGYDIVLLVDVIEHLNKDKGMSLVEDILKKNRNLLVATPKRFHKQGKVFSNPREIHRSFWKYADFKRLGQVIKIPFTHSIIVLLGKDTAMLKRYRLKRILKGLLPGFVGRWF